MGDRSDGKRRTFGLPSSILSAGRLPPTPLEVLGRGARRHRIDGKTAELQASLSPNKKFLNKSLKTSNPQARQSSSQGHAHHAETTALLFPEKKIQRIMVCKGSDRTLAPPTDLVRNGTSYRRAIAASRNGASIQAEKDWEF